jgi:formylglycine-generating enzyme required for sulfatase activity
MAQFENRDIHSAYGGLKSSLYQPQYSNSYAIVIGIDTYLNPCLQPLGKAEEDARSFADVLSAKPYNFQVDLLLGQEATRSAITQTLNKITKLSQPDDRVIFYFAGHGYIHPDNRGFDAGYLACADTNPDDPFDGLEYDEVKKLTRHAKAKHIAFILDACFSGRALGLTRAAPQPSAVQEYLLHNAYQVLTAGGVEVVSDAQSMTGELVRALREGLPGEEPPFTFNRLGQHIQDVIHQQSHGRQTPIYGFLEGSSKGQMVLVTPTLFDALPEELRQGLVDQKALVRRFAISEAEDYLPDPDLGENVRLILEKMQVEDEDRQVRQRAAEALRSLENLPEAETIPGKKEQPRLEVSGQESAGISLPQEKASSEDQPAVHKKLDWRWIASIAAVIPVLFILAWMGWRLWGPSPPGTETAFSKTATADFLILMDTANAATQTATANTSTLLAKETEVAKAGTATTFAETSTANALFVMETANAATEIAVNATLTAESSIPPACTEIGLTWTSPIDGMTLVCVPGGVFGMGMEEGADTEIVSNLVELEAFWIDRTEVTNAMFAQFVEKTGHPNSGSARSGQPDHPVTYVDWNDAEAYCRWANRQLPSEAQWELAARGIEGYTYPWGNQEPDCTLANSYNDAMEMYCVGYTTSVGSYPAGASPYDALDMAGNVWEWVNDWYGDYSGTGEKNPTGPTSGTSRVMRGGSWTNLWEGLHASYRSYNLPDHRDSSTGFRCAILPGE